MILKCAESMALKRAFSVSGLVSREEMQVSQDDNNMIGEVTNIDQELTNSSAGNVHVIEDNSTAENNEQLTRREEIIKNIIDGNQELKKELYDYLKYAKEENKLEKISINDLTDNQFAELKGLLEKIKKMMVKSA